jgi:D-sedoheptulose 7-phosphate isomerase
MSASPSDSAPRNAAAIFGDAAHSLQNVVSVAQIVERAAALVTQSLRDGGKVFFCGNGGSSADAQHLAGEFLGRFLVERDSWPAIALPANIAAMTAIGNDYGYEDVFSRQLRGLGRRGDALIAISTSGRSANVLKALQAAREIGVHAIGLTGANACPMDEIADLTIHAPATSTPRIQEMHIVIGHAICEIVEAALTA